MVDLSTSAPESTRRIHALLSAKGAAYLDAGISGGAAAADVGKLTLMVGGEKEALDKVRFVLDLFATNIFYVGSSGAGHTTKLLNNFLNAVSLAATAEVMVAGKKAGLDLAVLLEVFNKSSGVNFATLNRFPKIITGDYLKGGLTNTLMMKDVVLYTELASQLGVASLNCRGPPRRRSGWPRPSATPTRSATPSSTPSATSRAASGYTNKERAPRDHHPPSRAGGHRAASPAPSSPERSSPT